MLENEPFMGAFVKLPVTFLERLAIAAENHHARQARYCDASTLDGALSAISTWIEDLEKDRTQPSPTPERGDLLVKAARGEQWVLTVEGWRELAPIELVEQNVAGHPDFLVGPTADARAGWDERDTQPAKPRRFFGRSVVEDELDRLRTGVADRIERAEEVQREMAEAGARDTRYDWPPAGWPAAIAEALAELLELENAVDSVIGAAERRDLGVDERLTAFRDGLDHARVTLLTIATRHAAQGAE